MDTAGAVGRRARGRYRRQVLATPGGRESLARLRSLARVGAVVVICFEDDETRCHRQLVLAALVDDDARSAPG